MVLTKEQAEERIQELLNIAKGAIDRVTELAKEHGLEPSFMEMTFHHRRERGDNSHPLIEPSWFNDEYWSSSTAECEVQYNYSSDDSNE